MIKLRLTKFIFIFTPLFILGISLFTHQVHASTKELTGWASAPNIGAISFNCSNTGSCGTGAGQVNYAVSISDTGDLSGYAWSANIGWISFNATTNNTCPNAPCQAHVDTTGGAVTGWARALAGCQSDTGTTCTGVGAGNKNGVATSTGAVVTGNWDGWIHLSGPFHTSPGVGVTYNPTTGGFSGYAWGSDVVGWINFNLSSDGAEVVCPTCVTTPSCSLSSANVPPSGDVNLYWTINNDPGQTYSLTRNGTSFFTTSASSGSTVDGGRTTGFYNYTLSRSGGASCSSPQVHVNTDTTSSSGGMWIVVNPSTNHSKVHTAVHTGDPVTVGWDNSFTGVTSCSKKVLSTTNNPGTWHDGDSNIPDIGSERITGLTDGSYEIAVQCTDGTLSKTTNSVTIDVSQAEINEN